METIGNIENASNPFAVKSKATQGVAARKPLRGLDNRARNIPVKASFKEKSQLRSAKENVKVLKPVKSVKAQLDSKKEALQNIAELQACLPCLESYSTARLPEDVEDIDAGDSENPQLVSCYIKEIYGYMKALEAIFPIKKVHLQMQPEITGKMRSVLVDWLVQVHLRFHLLQETLYLTVSILDRYLQADKVKRSQLQLAGVTAMFIASKYEEMYAPDISDFVFITDTTYSKQEILQMEKSILKNLDFNLSKPLPLHFLRRNSKAANVDAMIHALAKFLMEMTLPEYELAYCLPSLLAAASLYLSLRLLTDASWSETLAFYSGYSEEEIMPVVRRMCQVVVDSEKSKLQAVRLKYSSNKLFKISTIPQLKSPLVAELAGTKK
jgi:hypothetical protein